MCDNNRLAVLHNLELQHSILASKYICMYLPYKKQVRGMKKNYVHVFLLCINFHIL